MTKEIIINAEKERTRIAILEDGTLAELYIENPEHERTLGNIVLGRVRRIMPSIRAAFIDIGQKQDAFLHFSDLSDNLPELLAFLEDDKPEVGKVTLRHEHGRHKGRRRRPHHDAPSASGAGSGESDAGGDGKAQRKKGRSRDAKSRQERRRAQHRARHKASGDSKKKNAAKGKDGNAAEAPQAPLESYLKRDQRILVKIVKEPISNKGSRVSTDISLAGRFLVLVPLADYVAVSKKIVSYKERRRLRTLAKSLAPEGFGVIVRTVAEGRNAKALDTDLRLLVERWRRIEAKLAEASKPPAVVYEDVNMASSIIRDLFSSDYDRVLIDEQRLYRNTKNYVQAVAPSMASAVKLHQSKKPIFEAVGIQGAVEEAFESRVDLPSGGYLFIERTEAMHVVDVNSGRSGRGMKQEDNALRCNLESARTIARQVRLRDLGGIIVVDFIDLRDDRNRKKVYDELKKAFKRDRAVTKILPMSDFGLVQITRQRLRPSITTYASADGTSNEDGADNGKAKGSPNGRGGARSEGRSGRSGRSKGGNEEKEGEREDSGSKGRRSGRGGSGRGGSGRGSSRSRRGRPAAPADDEAEAPALRTPEELLRALDAWLKDYKARGHRRPLTLRVHPFTAAFLNRGVPTHPTRWFMRHFIRVRVQQDASLNPLAYQFTDPRSGDDVTDLDTLDAAKTAA